METSPWIIQTGWDTDQDFVLKILSIAVVDDGYKVINDSFIKVHSGSDGLGQFIKTKIKEMDYDLIAPIHLFRLSEVI